MSIVSFSHFPKVGGRDGLGRYYTQTDVGRLLIDEMVGIAPKRLLDLGAGGGSLSSAAARRWLNLEVLTVDIDKSSSKRITKLFSDNGFRHKHIHADALSRSLPSLILAEFGKADAAVCNPPFTLPRWRKGYVEILEEVGFTECIPALRDVDAALLFLAQNIRLLSARATLGIILPDSLISASKYRAFRNHLLQRYSVHKVIRLPRNSFRGTDALAHILVLSNEESNSSSVRLQQLLPNRKLGQTLHISRDDAAERLDFAYHAQRQAVAKRNSCDIPLGSLATAVKRGTLTSAQARAFGGPVFHTSDMRLADRGAWCDLRLFGRAMHAAEFPTRASKGDILLARVGRNLEYKVIGVAEGEPVITDCVYKVAVPAEYRRSVLQQLSSSRGADWLASCAYGVGAKQLAKIDLMQFPLQL